MATASAIVDYHGNIFEEQDAQAARGNKADRVLALEVIRLKQQVSDINAALNHVTDMATRAFNLAYHHGNEVGHVEALLAETVSRVQVVEEELGWDAHDGQTMYGELAAPTADAA